MGAQERFLDTVPYVLHELGPRTSPLAFLAGGVSTAQSCWQLKPVGCIRYICLSCRYKCFSEYDLFTFIGGRYVESVLAAEKEKMKCCDVEYRFPVQSYQAFIYGGILVAGFFVYFVVIFFSSPVR